MSPLNPHVGIVALVPDNWEGYWQPRQQVLTRLARYFNVVWVNPAEELTRVSVRNRAETFSEPIPGFTVYYPEPWLPIVHRPGLLADLTLKKRLRNAGRFLESKGVTTKVLYIWRPNFERALELGEYDLSCYHVDDEYSFSDIEQPVQKREIRILSKVSQVFVHSPGLMGRLSKFNPNTEMVPNGVDFQAYSCPLPEPEDLVKVPRPRIGYTGWLKKQLDWPLLIHLTERHPEWSFVFVGPLGPHKDVDELIARLGRRKNVYLLGPKSKTDLPMYPQHFDVCLMPYISNHYTSHIYPLKLHEYMAAGRPSIGTRIRTLEDFKGYVTLAGTPDEWSSAIAKALRPESNTIEESEKRRGIAEQHDWDILVARIARTMSLRLGLGVTDGHLSDLNSSQYLRQRRFCAEPFHRIGKELCCE